MRRYKSSGLAASPSFLEHTEPVHNTMDDSDEYFDDSFVLDDDTLASIQATEERFGASLSQRPHTRSLPAQPRRQASMSPPPSKKLKRGLEISDLNPEIRVGADGSYVVGAQSTALNHAAINFGNTNVPVARSGLCSHTSELASLRAQLAEVSISMIGGCN